MIRFLPFRWSVFSLTAWSLLFFNSAGNASIFYSPGYARLVKQLPPASGKTGNAAEVAATPLKAPPTQSSPPNLGNAQAPAPDPFPDHVIFSTQADAIQWAQKMAPLLGGAVGATTFSVVAPANNPDYVTLQGYLHDTWQAYLKLFPSAVGALPEPPVIIVDTEQVNALVMPDLTHGPTQEKIGHAVWVFTGLIKSLKGTADRRAYTGLIGHELAHTVFRHLLPKYQAFYSRYFHPSAGVPFGYSSVNDATLAAQITHWQNDAILAGQEDLPELNNLPSPSPDPIHSLLFLMESMGDEYFPRADPGDRGPDLSQACAAVEPAYAKWWEDPMQQGLTAPPFNYDCVSGELVPAGGPAALGALTQRLLAQIHACADPGDGLDASTRPSYADYMGAPKTRLGIAVAAAYDGAPDSLAGLQAATEVVRKEMSGLETQIAFPTLGWFTYEEHADDCSALINHELYPEDPTGALTLATTLDALAQSIGADADELAACHASVSAGNIPPIGILEDPHHGICFRLSNVQRLAAAIEASGADFSALVSDFLNHSFKI